MVVNNNMTEQTTQPIKTTQHTTEVKCPKCKHRWLSKSKMIWVTCPSCQYKCRTKSKDEE